MGFEPTEAYARGSKENLSYKECVWKPYGERIEDAKNTRIDIDQLLEDFEMFCKVDLQLADLSIKNHIREIKRFLKTVKINPYWLTKSDLRNYLSPFSQKNPYVYKTVLAALKRFFRDFLKRPEVVDGLRFPKYPFQPKKFLQRKNCRNFISSLKIIGKELSS